MADHPFPLPRGFESDWTAREWQSAANHYWYEIQGVDRSELNYRPVLSLLESAFRHATRKAQALRAVAASFPTTAPQSGGGQQGA